jgi:hypothetical protein
VWDGVLWVSHGVWLLSEMAVLAIL